MSPDRPVELADEERDAFLGSGGTGVLSFGTDAEAAPHSIPVSYGYDATETTFYFRLATGADSDKGDPTDRPVTFVTYGQDDDGWRSVVAHGRLEPVDDDAIATQTLAGLDRVHIPLFDVFGEPVRTVSFAFFRLVPAALTSRKETETDA